MFFFKFIAHSHLSVYHIGMKNAALTVVEQACGLKTGERVLIVTNPNPEVLDISLSLQEAVLALGGESVLIVQKTKTLLDYADKAVIAALKTNPDVLFSISENKIGKDEEAILHPYLGEDGTSYDHIFDYNLEEKKTMRAVWTPGITKDMFKRTVCIDYDLLQRRCSLLASKFNGAVSIKVTAPGGTDIVVPVKGRKGMVDDGNFAFPGSGGNIPAGEVFISPVVGSKGSGCQGTIVFDGSMSLTEGDIIINDPIVCHVVDGFVTSITNKSGKKVDGSDKDCEAYKLLRSVTDAEKAAVERETEGKLAAGLGKEYQRNARNIGELGIGLNPSARIEGNMLEDEKAFHTCHFAIGQNYDNDAPSLIHLDGVVRNPTIVILYEDGSEFLVEKEGILSPILENPKPTTY